MTLQCPARFALVAVPSRRDEAWIGQLAARLHAEKVTVVVAAPSLEALAIPLAHALGSAAEVDPQLAGMERGVTPWPELEQALQPVADLRRGEAVVVLMAGDTAPPVRWVEIGG